MQAAMNRGGDTGIPEHKHLKSFLDPALDFGATCSIRRPTPYFENSCFYLNILLGKLRAKLNRKLANYVQYIFGRSFFIYHQIINTRKGFK